MVESRFCRIKFTNASEIGKEILKFNIFLISKYTYLLWIYIFFLKILKEKDAKTIVDVSVKNSKVNEIENT